MTGKHAAPPLEHTRRSVIMAAIPLGVTAASIMATGEIPKVQEAPKTAPPPFPPPPVGREWEEVLHPREAQQIATSRRQALAKERKAKAAARRAQARRAARSKRPKPIASSRADRVIAISRDYFGIPYRWGGKTASGGLDCSGYVALVYSRAGVRLPHGSRAQARCGVQVQHPEPGDLLFVRNALGIVHHVAIYVGDGYMHDAPRTGLTVGRRRIWSKPSRTFYRRVL